MLRYNPPPLRIEPGTVVKEPRYGIGIVFEVYADDFVYVQFDSGAAITLSRHTLIATEFIFV